MSNQHSLVAHNTIAILVSLDFLSLPLVTAVGQLPPIVINAGTSCFPAPMPFNDPSLRWDRCGVPHYAFGYCNQTGNPCYLQLLSGPGVIDSATGVWSWSNIPPSAAGQVFQVRVRAVDAVNRDFGPDVTMSVSIFADPPPYIQSGCQGTTSFTGDTVRSQIVAAQSSCSLTWSANESYGANPIQFNVDQSGLLTAVADQPGLYAVRVILSDGLAKDSCDHIYVVNGHGACCHGTRGNVDGQGIVDLGDLTTLVRYLTYGYTPLQCYEAANVDGIGIIDLADLSYLVSYLTSGAPALPSCP